MCQHVHQHACCDAVTAAVSETESVPGKNMAEVLADTETSTSTPPSVGKMRHASEGCAAV